MRNRRCRGQAGVEALALVPLLALTVALVWQLVVLVNGSLLGYERVRAEAMSARGPGTIAVRRTVAVPSLVPGVRRLEIPIRAAVRAP